MDGTKAILTLAYLLSVGILGGWLGILATDAGAPGLVGAVIAMAIWFAAFIPIGILAHYGETSSNSLLGRFANWFGVSGSGRFR